MKNEWEKQQDWVIFKKIGIWNTLAKVQKVFLHWKYSHLSPLHLRPYLKGECNDQKAKPHKSTLVLGDQNGIWDLGHRLFV